MSASAFAGGAAPGQPRTSTALTARQAILLISRREFLSQVRSRSFVIGIVFTLVIFGAVGGVVAFVSAQTSQHTLGLTAQTADLRPALEQRAQLQDTDLQITQIDQDAGLAKVRSDDLDALLTGTPGSYRLVFHDAVDSTVQPLVQTAVEQQTLNAALSTAGLDPAAVANQGVVTPDTLEPADPNQGQQLLIAFAGTFLLFMGIQFGAGVASGVVEEKQSRVVELLLSTIKARHLLTGKVLGIGAAGLLSMVILGLVAGTAASIFGLLTLPSAAFSMFAMVLLWYLIGFFLFAAVYAALGSTVSRQEELQPLLTPVIFIVIIPFVLTLNLLPNDPRNPLIEVLSFIPFISQIAMPARYALGVAPLWQVAVSAVLAIAAIVVVVRLAARIYQNSILRTGSRVSLREAIRAR